MSSGGQTQTFILAQEATFLTKSSPQHFILLFWDRVSLYNPGFKLTHTGFILTVILLYLLPDSLADMLWEEATMCLYRLICSLALLWCQIRQLGTHREQTRRPTGHEDWSRAVIVNYSNVGDKKKMLLVVSHGFRTIPLYISMMEYLIQCESSLTCILNTLAISLYTWASPWKKMNSIQSAFEIKND